MAVRGRDALKLFEVSVIVCCAVLVCTLFLNFYLDLLQVEPFLAGAQAQLFFAAQASTAKIVCLVTGGCLLASSAVMLLFYLKQYIDTHSKELGILKAMGYSNPEIAKSFWVFGLSVLTGGLAGFAGAFALMPIFYELQNKDKILPQILLRFHPSVLLGLVLLPSAGFALLAVLYAIFKLKRPVLSLLQDRLAAAREKPAWGAAAEGDRPFLPALRADTLRRKKVLAFFILFGAFCFSSMTQMSASMKELSSRMMGVMMLVIGLVLACTTLFLAIATVLRGNAKAVAMMRVFGYSAKECGWALLGCYRPLAFVGFALGTGYQYLLLRIMVDLVFRDLMGGIVYRFDLKMMLVSLMGFVVFYELGMAFCRKRLEQAPLGQVMLE